MQVFAKHIMPQICAGRAAGKGGYCTVHGLELTCFQASRQRERTKWHEFARAIPAKDHFGSFTVQVDSFAGSDLSDIRI